MTNEIKFADTVILVDVAYVDRAVSYTHLKSIPRYVNHVRLNPKEVDYLIEQRIKFND